MIKVIRDFVEKPQFLMMCDCSCGVYSVAPFEPGSFEDQQMSVWAAELQKQGWKITLARHACPAHVRKEAESGLIIVPSLSSAAFKN
jgi:hypothetical protein